MSVSAIEWAITLGITLAVLLVDVLVFARRPHEPTRRECLTALGFYIGLAVLFGIWVWNFHGGQFGLEFYAGWLTEYSLSIDNLFVFVVVLNYFAIPTISISMAYILKQKINK